MKRHLPNEKERIELAREFCELFKKGDPFSLDFVWTLGGIQKAAVFNLKRGLVDKKIAENIIVFLKKKNIPYKLIKGELFFLAPQTQNPEKEFKILKEALKLEKATDWKSKEKYHRLLGEFFGIPKAAVEDFIKYSYPFHTAGAEGLSLPLPQFRPNFFAGFHYDRKTKDSEVLETAKKKEEFIKKYFPRLYKQWAEEIKKGDESIFGIKE